ncbi:hypothetical protein Tco_0285356 [Tanacetum coccineum]
MIAVRGTFNERRPPEDDYDHNREYDRPPTNDWDTSAHRGESSTTSYSSEISSLLPQQNDEMRKDMIQMFCSNQKVNSVTPSLYFTESTTRVPTFGSQSSPSSRSSEIPLSPYSSPSKLPKRNPHQPLIIYPSRLNKEKLQDKSDIQVHEFLQMFKKHHFNISLAEALALMPNTYFVTNKVTQDKNLKEKTSFEALVILEDSSFLPLSSDRELLFYLKLSVTETLLSFSSENEDKVFNPGIVISKGVRSLSPLD